ncbi:MAG: hypothetical protein K0B07_02530 [DPANN group archaeon]|nr:hypothetical protein [DPANN group archaeon]
MNKVAKIILFALIVVGLIVSTGVASPYKGDYSVQDPNYSEDRHELMQDAFDTLNYDAWYQLMTADGRTPRVAEVVTESNFELFVQAHEAAENGNMKLVAELRAELGLNNGICLRDGNDHSKGFGQGNGQKMSQNNFIDNDNDGNCDNLGTNSRRGR